jgi:Dak1 domain
LPTHSHGLVGLFFAPDPLLTFFLAKHFLNDPSSLVVQSLQGLCAINPKLGLDVNNKVVYLAEQDKSKVGLICGGGSGHEPSHAGFVGQIIIICAILLFFLADTIHQAVASCRVTPILFREPSLTLIL